MVESGKRKKQGDHESVSASRLINRSTAVQHPGLYIHVPFCQTKCIYCDFYSVTDSNLIDRWLNALETETALYEKTFETFDSVFIGGGTPSLLDTHRMKRLTGMLKRRFAFAADTEFTMEANPDDIDEEKLTLMRSLGVNRISLGIQSFNDRELQFLKRRHDAAGATRAIRATRDLGFANVGLDLMYGLPGQSKADWLATLERAVSFGPTHLSCYQLTLEGKTPLRTLIESGAEKLPNDEKSRQLFLLTSRFLASHGFVHYEVSNFASAEQHRCRHNQKYWHHIPYLGLGPAAHSFDGTRRWWNCRSVSDYCTRIERGSNPIEGKESLTAEQIGLEQVYLGLRTSAGVRLEDVADLSEAALYQLRKSRLVRLDRGRIKPTTRGYLVADSLPLLLSGL